MTQTRNLDPSPSGEILSGQRFRITSYVVRLAFGDDASAVHSRAEADVDDVIRILNRILIMLDYYYRVTDVS